jgi:steroid 5-alpha reductase family enzyme
MAHSASQARAFAWVLFMYLLAAAGAILAAALLPAAAPLIKVAQADVAGTVLIFLFSLAFRNASCYDAYWSVAPPLIAVYYVSLATPPLSLQQVLLLLLVFAWGVRLTWNWARGWSGFGHEDWRYGELRRQSGPWYPAVNFLGIHLFPTLIVYLGCLGLYPALALGGRPFGWLDLAAALLALGGILLEALADEQLRRFRQSGPPQGAILRSGLWALVRHPNYLGEITFWWGVCLFGLAAQPGWLASLAGPLAMTALFVFISIPLMDRRMKRRRPGYAEHCRQVPALFPLPGFLRGGKR